jgi:hypothetical protein
MSKPQPQFPESQGNEGQWSADPKIVPKGDHHAGYRYPLHDDQISDSSNPFAVHQLAVIKCRLWSWLCENAPAEALTAGHIGEVGELSHFPEFDEFLVGSCA